MLVKNTLLTYLKPRTIAVLGGILVFALLVNQYANSGLSIGLATARAGHGNLVSVYVDGEKHIVSTKASTVATALRDFNVTLQKGDVVEPGLNSPIDQQSYNINIYRAVPTLIVDNGKSSQIMTGYQSPRQIASAAGLTIFPEDHISLQKITDFANDDLVGNKVIITRAKPVQIVLGGQTYNFRTQARTVKALLDEHKIEVAPEDTLSIPLAERIDPGLRLVINKISQDIVAVNQPIASDVQITYDDNLPLGTEQIKQLGSEGLQQLTYLVKYKDKVETARSLLASKVLKPMKTKIVVRGRHVANDVWARLRQCEAGGDYTRNSGNGYYGAYQFLVSTWQANGGTGRPDQASPAEQDRIAQLLQSRRGWSPWPVCSVKLGLR